jgi:hypothetical protein
MMTWIRDFLRFEGRSWPTRDSLSWYSFTPVPRRASFLSWTTLSPRGLWELATRRLRWICRCLQRLLVDTCSPSRRNKALRSSRWLRTYQHFDSILVNRKWELFGPPLGRFDHGVEGVGYFKLICLEETQLISSVKPRIQSYIFLLQFLLELGKSITFEWLILISILKYFPPLLLFGARLDLFPWLKSAVPVGK